MKCKVPDCKAVAVTTFALVEVCDLHHDELIREAAAFYRKSTMHGSKVMERALFESIRHLSPWKGKR